ncbi:MAG: NYN domain-containing protein [Clostridiales bacterium]|nr:NYN domain-containing protein [Clostridiales bacterium]
MKKRDVLIVDGYNVIRHAGGAYETLFAADPDSARTRLVADVAAFAHGEYRAIVVFDGAGNPYSDGVVHQVAGVDVIFSASGVDADTVIERLALEARGAGEKAVVVSSDTQTQWSVMGAGITRMPSSAFIEEVHRVREDSAEFNPSGSMRSTVSERIEPEVRERLSRWSRGHR